MRFAQFLLLALATGFACLTGACVSRPQSYSGPGCLVDLYSLPALRGVALPVRGDTEDLASAWHDTAVSAKVVFGTWRFYSNADFTGFSGDYVAPADIPSFGPVTKLGSLRCLAPAPPPPSPY
jgi:hypothetical protein